MKVNEFQIYVNKWQTSSSFCYTIKLWCSWPFNSNAFKTSTQYYFTTLTWKQGRFSMFYYF